MGIKLYNESNGSSFGDNMEFKIIGIWLKNNSNNNTNEVVLLSEDVSSQLWNLQKENLEYYYEIKTNYKIENTVYYNVYVPFNHTIDEIENLWSMYQDNKYKKDDSKIKLTSSVISSLEMVDILIKELSTVSFVITIICLILSIMGCTIVSNILNETLSIGTGVIVFVFGAASIFVLILIAILTSVLATLLPVYNAARKKPVESIKSL